ncbi:unnamed protein product [Dracunculus medinensis]|uniref:Thioredoxin-like_fold domain-containing protein n=1 Tax=Dracunculus medinensis TaxID=318479 RepID=A0A0N4UGL1_DRAME|nr:unnamed protein product [Dracunculus medinensis]
MLGAYDRDIAELTLKTSIGHTVVYRELASKYGVEGIPALIIIKSNGDVITKNGRADVSVLIGPCRF